MNHAEMTASCQFVQGSYDGFEQEAKTPLSQLLLAQCLLHVSVFPEMSDLARLCITALPPQAQSLTLEIPLVHDRDRGFLPWFEIRLALLPRIPLRLTVHAPALTEPGLDVLMELADGHVQVRNDGQREAFIGEIEERVLDEAFWFDSLGYKYLQASWLLRLGGHLAHHHDPGNAYQTVRYLPDRQVYEYRQHFVSAEGMLQDYVCFHDDLLDIEWEHALVLEHFVLGFSADADRKRQ